MTSIQKRSEDPPSSDGTPPLPEDSVDGPEKRVNTNTKILVDFLNSLPRSEQNELKAHFLGINTEQKCNQNTSSTNPPSERKNGILNLPPETQRILAELQKKDILLTNQN